MLFGEAELSLKNFSLINLFLAVPSFSAAWAFL